MSSGVEQNFVLQQGFDAASCPAGPRFYGALLLQPRIVGAGVVLGTFLQSPWVFLILSAILWWAALLPGLNPFDFAYNSLLAGRSGRPRLGSAPPPRRFAQGLAGTFALAIGWCLLAGARPPAEVLEALFLMAVAPVALGWFCAGSFAYHVLRGNARFAARTLPWSRSAGS